MLVLGRKIDGSTESGYFQPAFTSLAKRYAMETKRAQSLPVCWPNHHRRVSSV
jgi:hypothetical protein